MKVQQADSKQMALIYDLYMEAFPADERKPFKLMEQKVQKGQMEMLAIEEEGQFVGLAISILHKDMVLIDYFAIASECRGKGIGGKALELLKERYQDRRMFLEIEVIDEKAENNAERIRRKAFYLQHGLSEAKIYVCLFGVDMELLTVQCGISFEEYYSVYEEVFGQEIKELSKKIYRLG